VKTVAKKKRWGIQFWDFGEWNWLSTGKGSGGFSDFFDSKPEAVSEAQRMNREGHYRIEGHNLRVREYKK
jgi:hypothetical protein